MAGMAGLDGVVGVPGVGGVVGVRWLKGSCTAMELPGVSGQAWGVTAQAGESRQTCACRALDLMAMPGTGWLSKLLLMDRVVGEPGSRVALGLPGVAGQVGVGMAVGQPGVAGAAGRPGSSTGLGQPGVAGQAGATGTMGLPAGEVATELAGADRATGLPGSGSWPPYTTPLGVLISATPLALPPRREVPTQPPTGLGASDAAKLGDTPPLSVKVPHSLPE